MAARREDVDQIPRAELEMVMRYLANLNFPEEGRAEPIPADEVVAFTRRLKFRTDKYWPELWRPVDEGEPMEKIEERARLVVRKMRGYLRRFWREPDHRARDWYIHRAREYYQRHYVLPKTSAQRQETKNIALTSEEVRNAESWVNIESENLLDEPPVSNPIEKALYGLQERALIPSRRPLYCDNRNCARPYFLSEKKGTKFCSLECARPSLLASKRTYAKKSKKTRRTQ
jgi:hypothetical protein